MQNDYEIAHFNLRSVVVCALAMQLLLYRYHSYLGNINFIIKQIRSNINIYCTVKK